MCIISRVALIKSRAAAAVYQCHDIPSVYNVVVCVIFRELAVEEAHNEKILIDFSVARFTPSDSPNASTNSTSTPRGWSLSARRPFQQHLNSALRFACFSF